MNNYICTKHSYFAFVVIDKCEFCKVEGKQHFAKRIPNKGIDKSNSKMYSKGQNSNLTFAD